MKITIEYESETLLSKELEEQFKKCLKSVQENRLESDKVNCCIMNLRGSIIRWLSENKQKELS
jgi:hypothetical protein